MTGPLLSNEKWQEHLADGEERRRLRDAAVSKASAVWTKFHSDTSRWQEEVREATRAGSPIPPRPPEPDAANPSETVALFEAERREHDRAGHRLLLELSDEIEAAVSRAEAELDERRKAWLEQGAELAGSIESCSPMSAPCAPLWTIGTPTPSRLRRGP